MGPRVYQYRSSIGVFELIESVNTCELRLGDEVLGIYSSTTAALSNVDTVIAGRYESDLIESLMIPSTLKGWDKTAG